MIEPEPIKHSSFFLQWTSSELKIIGEKGVPIFLVRKIGSFLKFLFPRINQLVEPFLITFEIGQLVVASKLQQNLFLFLKMWCHKIDRIVGSAVYRDKKGFNYFKECKLRHFNLHFLNSQFYFNFALISSANLVRIFFNESLRFGDFVQHDSGMNFNGFYISHNLGSWGSKHKHSKA